MSKYQQFIDIVSNASITIPAMDLTIVIATLTLCLVFKFSKTGLIVAYLFCYKLGWSVMLQHGDSYVAGYMSFGILVGVTAVIAMFKPDK